QIGNKVWIKTNKMNLTRRKFIKLLGTTSLAAIAGNTVFSKSNNSNLTKVRVAYPPTMAALPLAKGAQEEFFLKEDTVKPFLDQNIELTLIPAKGSSDAAGLVSGERADCSITGLSSSMYAIQGPGNLKISSTAFDPNDFGRHLGLVSSNLYHDIPSLSDLVENWLDGSAGRSIILSLRRDDHFSTDQLLKKEGYQGNDNIYYADQEDIISRLYGLLNDTFVSTVLPEPLLTLALKNPEFHRFQVSLISDYPDVTLPPLVFVFNQKVLNKNPGLVKRFYRGWDTALEKTNASSNLELINLTTKIISETLPSLRNAIKNTQINEEFASLFDIPNFSGPKPLNEEIFNDVLDWAISKGYLKEKISFKRAYDGSSAIFAEESR
ncbi:MAG: hypothetical protein V5A79_00375, partial [Candidatus Bipolaricaulota bacterium]